MKQFELFGKTREKSTKGYLNELKAQGLVPGVIYGKENNINVCFFINDLKKLLYTKEVYKVLLNIDDKQYHVVVKNTQYHPLSDEPMHIDLMEADDEKVIKMSYPIIYSGAPIGVRQGGKIFKKLRVMKLKGKISHLPDDLNIDISNLKLGDTLKIKDISIPNVEILEAQGTPLVTVIRSRVADTATSSEGEESGEKPEA